MLPPCIIITSQLCILRTVHVNMINNCSYAIILGAKANEFSQFEHLYLKDVNEFKNLIVYLYLGVAFNF